MENYIPKIVMKMKQKSGLLVCLALLLMVSCKMKPDNTNDVYVKLVKTAQAEEVSSINTKYFPSVVKEGEEMNLSFRVAGPIEEILVKEGDYVEQGQLVAVLDSRDYDVQWRAANAQVEQLRSEYKRVAELKTRNSIAVNEYEKMKAGKEMAESKLKNTKDQLDDTRLYAPFSGYVTKVNFESGELVNHGTTIVTMVDVSVLKVEIDVPASLYIHRDSIILFECTHEDISGHIYPLTLYGHNIKGNNNGLYKLYLYHQPTLDCLLVPGMNVSVGVSSSNRGLVQLRVPLQAIFTQDENEYVWLVKDDRVYATQVTVGLSIHDAGVNVLNGLGKGDRVVVGGLNLLKEGEKVRIIASQSKTNVGNLL